MRVAIVENDIIVNIAVVKKITDIAGAKELRPSSTLSIGDTFDEVKALGDDSPLIPIIIDAVSNTLPDFDDSDNQYTVVENSESIATGSGLLAFAGQKFRVPFVRTDTNRKAFMVAQVAADGAFSITLNFKTGGEWVVDEALVNSELPTPVFSMPEYRFKVV